jgi:hypothetical protein
LRVSFSENFDNFSGVVIPAFRAVRRVIQIDLLEPVFVSGAVNFLIDETLKIVTKITILFFDQ